MAVVVAKKLINLLLQLVCDQERGRAFKAVRELKNCLIIRRTMMFDLAGDVDPDRAEISLDGHRARVVRWMVQDRVVHGWALQLAHRTDGAPGLSHASLKLRPTVLNWSPALAIELVVVGGAEGVELMLARRWTIATTVGFRVGVRALIPPR